jgi:hypothetical protein
MLWEMGHGIWDMNLQKKFLQVPHQSQIALHPLLLFLGISRRLENALSEIFDNAPACSNAAGVNIRSQKSEALVGRLELDFFGVQGKPQPVIPYGQPAVRGGIYKGFVRRQVVPCGSRAFETGVFKRVVENYSAD